MSGRFFLVSLSAISAIALAATNAFAGKSGGYRRVAYEIVDWHQASKTMTIYKNGKTLSYAEVPDKAVIHDLVSLRTLLLLQKEQAFYHAHVDIDKKNGIFFFDKVANSERENPQIGRMLINKVKDDSNDVRLMYWPDVEQRDYRVEIVIPVANRGQTFDSIITSYNRANRNFMLNSNENMRVQPSPISYFQRYRDLIGHFA